MYPAPRRLDLNAVAYIVPGLTPYVTNAWAGVLLRVLEAGEGAMPAPRLSPPCVSRLPGTGRKPIGIVLRDRLAEIRRGHGRPQ